MFYVHRCDRRRDNDSFIDPHFQLAPHANRPRFEFGTENGGPSHQSFARFAKVITALNQSASGLWFEQQDAIFAVVRAQQNGVEWSQLLQHDFVELVRSQISGARFATPTVKTKCQSWIKIKIRIIDGAPTFGTVAVRTRHQSIESVVNFSQTCLEQFSPF